MIRNKRANKIGNVFIYHTIFLFWGFLLHQKRIMLHVCDKCNLYIDACIMIVHI